MNDGTALTTYKKALFIMAVLFMIGLILVLGELALRLFMGLGNPVLYNSSPLYGYRPLPDKKYRRFRGANVQINNLGLRADRDWDNEREEKILFLGDSVTYGGSYIDNQDLFSQRVVKFLNATNASSYVSGNAGVNAWGIENIVGLIMEAHFLPAKIYITTVPEKDFYRGLTRIQGLPFFNIKPTFAFQELWYFFCYRQNNNRYEHWTTFHSEEETLYIVEKAVKKLHKMDTFLKEQGYKHFFFISPSKAQVIEGTEKDAIVYDLLMKYNVPVYYIVDGIKRYHLTPQEQSQLFHDEIHLDQRGHELWAKIIASELQNTIFVE
ncbi:hypothetical protein GF339_04685 [candidate division KSB3 bacterium]|uniref:SGNH hydrolase-type esterase domain-containing protein n=1 Tax=candidate division KSB3 bacterium TaxID=2044937 RepID=A0A9D5JTS5_9BACT|nr:hypothetical protein [candidate division KSB3 bacterium]MBD3323856.1 hypothetical protein [candidate division KSB3 bacterium]